MTMTNAGSLRRFLLLTVCPLAAAATTVPAAAQVTQTTPTVAPAAPGAPKAPGASTTETSQTTKTPASSAGIATSGAANGESVIVTGTRNLGKKARDSTSPIDVITNATLVRTGQPNLADQLSRSDPSVSIVAMGQDTETLTNSIRLRGLNPNDVLVLIDGKRRHETSNIAADFGPDQGATPVDIDMIPAAAIDHVEVLRDGAAAQYGSDAIAGVVNIIMKKTDHGGSGSAYTGADAYNGDGWTYQLNADQGASFGSDGYVHLGGALYHTDFFVAPATDDRAASGGFLGNSNKILGEPEQTRETLSIDFGATLLPNLFGGVQGYGLITYGHRHAAAYENYRPPSKLPQVWPAGFSPLETDEENDYAATLGLKAEDFFGFHVDLSTTYGADQTNIGNKDTANVSLYQEGFPAYGYPANFTPTTVLAQSQRNAQWTNNLDFTRPFTMWNTQMNLAFGAEERSEEYELGAGSPASYVLGGTAGFGGLLPANAGDFSRNVWATYLDYDVHPIQHLDIDIAGRFEHYTDFGNTYDGKISSRYDFTNWFSVRGTISNGTRAPTLAEENFSALNVSPTGASGILAVNSPAAKSIGAVPLKPERSTNESAGIVLQPLTNLSVTTDVYQINIRDRIVGSLNVANQPAITAIEETGASLQSGLDPADVYANYFTNGASTRTQGLDINVSYFTDFRNQGFGTVTWTAGIDLNRSKIHHVATNSTGQPVLNAQGIAYLTTVAPRSKIVLNAFWKIDRFDVDLRQTRYGQTSDEETYEDLAPAALAFSTTQFAPFTNPPAWLTDLEVGYQIAEHLHVAVGGNDLFNVRPRRLPADQALYNVQYYDNVLSGVPITGGLYYARLNATW